MFLSVSDSHIVCLYVVVNKLSVWLKDDCVFYLLLCSRPFLTDGPVKWLVKLSSVPGFCGVDKLNPLSHMCLDSLCTD